MEKGEVEGRFGQALSRVHKESINQRTIRVVVSYGIGTA